MPGVYLRETSSGELSVRTGGNSERYAIIGTAGYGPLIVEDGVDGVNTIDLTTVSKLNNVLGPVTTDHLGLITAKEIIKAGGTVVYGRVAGEGKAKAHVTVGTVTFTAKYYGKGGNNFSVQVIGTTEPYTLKVLLNGSVVETFVGLLLSSTTDPKYFDFVKSDYIVVDDTGTSSSITAGTYPLVGGIDGVYTDMTVANTDIIAALSAIQNLEALDVDVVLAPGFTHAEVTAKIVSVCTNRKDCFGIVDYPLGTSAAAVALNVTPWMTEQGMVACYWPWIKVADEELDTNVMMPASSIGAIVHAQSDTRSALWYAAAGPKRGVVENAIAPEYIMDTTERESIYASCVNPIILYPGVGCMVYGNKDLCSITDENDPNISKKSLNNRKVLIHIMKVAKALSANIVFDPGDPTFFDTWKGPIETFLENIKHQNGITDYRIIMDISAATPEQLAANKMPGAIKISFMPTAEDLYLDFILGQQGITFV